MKCLCILCLFVCLLHACVDEDKVPEGVNSEQEGAPCVVFDSIIYIGNGEAEFRLRLTVPGNGKIQKLAVYYSERLTTLDSCMKAVWVEPTVDFTGCMHVRIEDLASLSTYHVRIVVEARRLADTTDVYTFQTKIHEKALTAETGLISVHSIDNAYFRGMIYGDFELNKGFSCGCVYALHEYPTLEDIVVENDHIDKEGWFRCHLINFIRGRKFYYRAYVKSAYGVVYGESKEAFIFSDSDGEVVTSPVHSVSDISAVTGYLLIHDGGAGMKRTGVCWGTEKHPNVSNYVEVKYPYKPTRIKIDGLQPETTYYVRSFIENDLGFIYGEEYSFTTGKPGTQVMEPWEIVTEVPVPLPEAYVCKQGECLYVMDVHPARQGECVFWEYGLASGKWRKLASFPGERRYFALLAGVGDDIYFGLNFMTEEKYDWWKYDIAKDAWESLPPTPLTAGYYRSAVVDGSLLYIVDHDYLRVYDTEKEEWRTVWTSGFKINGAFAFGNSEHIFYGGGFMGNDAWSEVWEFRFGENTWTKKNKLPFKNLSKSVVFECNGYVYCCGGGVIAKDWERSTGALFRYEAQTDHWVRCADFPYAFEAIGFCCPMNEYIFHEGKLWRYIPANDPTNGLSDVKPSI